MRTLLAILLATSALLALPTATAQDPAPPLAEDPSGDVRGTPLGGPTQSMSGFEDVDLTGLWFEETPTTFEVRLRLANMDGQPGPDQPGTYTFLRFDGVETRLWMGRSSDNAAWFGSYSTRADGASSFRYVGPLSVRYDEAAGEVWTTLGRDEVVGASGRSPGRGDAIEGIRAESWANLGRSMSFNDPTIPVKGYLLDVGDRVPDTDGLRLDVQHGGALASGGVRLAAAEPYRASNGAATTYVYGVTASNQGESTRVLTLEAQHVPAGWNVTLPGAELSLDAGATVEFQVAVATPFRHQHGASESFHLRLADPADPAASALVELGVHYLAVAQPSGHHPTLFLHTHPWSETAAVVNPVAGGTTGIVTMNTLEEDPEDAGVPITAYSALGSVGQFYGWAACLDPALAMGLDFAQGVGSLILPVSTQRPIAGAVLTGRLLHVAPGLETTSCFPSTYRDLEVTELATIEATAPFDLGAGGQHDFEATIAPLVDRVPYVPGASLVLELSLRGDGVGLGGTGGPTLQPGGRLDLPLEEYADALPAFSGVTQATDGAAFVPSEGEPAEDAPALALPLLAAALLALAVMRRQ